MDFPGMLTHPGKQRLTLSNRFFFPLLPTVMHKIDLDKLLRVYVWGSAGGDLGTGKAISTY